MTIKKSGVIREDKDDTISQQEAKIASLRQQLSNLTTSAAGQMQYAAEEISQLRQYIEELNAENGELVNDLQDCLLENEKCQENVSMVSRERDTLLELNRLIVSENDELADRLEKEIERNPNSLDYQQLIQDIRDVCYRKMKLLHDESATLENTIRLQQSEMEGMIHAIITGKVRVRYLENVLSELKENIIKLTNENVEREDLLQRCLGLCDDAFKAEMGESCHQSSPLSSLNHADRPRPTIAERSSSMPSVTSTALLPEEGSQVAALKPGTHLKHKRSNSLSSSKAADLGVMPPQQTNSFATSTQHDILQTVRNLFPASRVTDSTTGNKSQFGPLSAVLSKVGSSSHEPSPGLLLEDFSKGRKPENICAEREDLLQRCLGLCDDAFKAEMGESCHQSSPLSSLNHADRPRPTIAERSSSMPSVTSTALLPEEGSQVAALKPGTHLKHKRSNSLSSSKAADLGVMPPQQTNSFATSTQHDILQTVRNLFPASKVTDLPTGNKSQFGPLSAMLSKIGPSLHEPSPGLLLEDFSKCRKPENICTTTEMSSGDLTTDDDFF